MIKIIILNSLRNEIYKTFKKESSKIYSLIEKLKENPNKGKMIGNINGISLRELKYKSYRFYYVVDGYRLDLFNSKKLEELLIRFIRMSKKNNQQKVISEIESVLKGIKR